MTSANVRKPKYTGEFEIWGTDACRNYDYCGGRITLFVANKKCISCDPESYKKREALPDDSANERKQLSELVRDFLLKYHDSKVRDDDDLEIAFTVGYRHGRESMIEPDSANDEDFEKVQAEIEILKMQLEIAKDALDEIQHITIGGLKMDAADGMEPLDWKYHARNALAAIAKDVK